MLRLVGAAVVANGAVSVVQRRDATCCVSTPVLANHFAISVISAAARRGAHRATGTGHLPSHSGRPSPTRGRVVNGHGAEPHANCVTALNNFTQQLSEAFCGVRHTHIKEGW